MDYTLGKQDKLKSRKAIGQLFVEGKSVKSYPIRLVYLPVTNDETETKVAFSVPKRNFKLAVHRNKVKRLLREAYRLQKSEMIASLPHHYLMIIYMGKTIPTYQETEVKMTDVLRKFNSLFS